MSGPLIRILKTLEREKGTPLPRALLVGRAELHPGLEVCIDKLLEAGIIEENEIGFVLTEKGKAKPRRRSRRPPPAI